MKITCSKKALHTLFIAILLTITHTISAQNGFVQGTEGCHHLVVIDHDPQSWWPSAAETFTTLGSDCEFTKFVSVNILGNNLPPTGNNNITLAGQNSIKENTEDGVIPGYPAMFIEYSFGGSAPQYVEIEYFIHTETASCVGDIYTAYIPLTYNFSAECSRNGEPGGTQGGNGGQGGTRDGCDTPLSIPYSIKLVMPVAGGYADYPVELYTGPDDIFSCDAFEETAGCCDPSDCGPFTFQSEGAVKVCCGPCGGTTTTPPTQTVETPSRRTTRGLNQLNDNLISPNPFQSVVNIQFADNNMELTHVDVVDMHGKVVKSLAPRTITKGEQISISTENLAQGIYYIRINTAKGVESHKVIKL